MAPARWDGSLEYLTPSLINLQSGVRGREHRTAKSGGPEAPLLGRTTGVLTFHSMRWTLPDTVGVPQTYKGGS